MRGIVDRIEGDYVICETEGPQMRQIPISMFCDTPKDGDVVEIGEDSVKILPEETQKRKEEMQALFDRLKRKSGGKNHV